MLKISKCIELILSRSLRFVLKIPSVEYLKIHVLSCNILLLFQSAHHFTYNQFSINFTFKNFRYKRIYFKRLDIHRRHLTKTFKSFKRFKTFATFQDVKRLPVSHNIGGNANLYTTKPFENFQKKERSLLRKTFVAARQNAVYNSRCDNKQ